MVHEFSGHLYSPTSALFKLVQYISNNTKRMLPFSVIALLRHKCTVDTVFEQALIQQGAVTTLTAAACLLAAPSFNEDIDLFDTCFSTILRYIMLQLGHNLVTQALRAGFLQDSGEDARLQTSIKDLKFAVKSKSLRGFPLSETWDVFWWMLHQRLNVMAEYLDRGLSFKACDNLAASSFCVSTLNSLTPQSVRQQCQAVDWKDGGHREACRSLLLLCLDSPTNVSSRDKLFMCFLIHSDYLEQKKGILVKEVQCLRATLLLPSVLPYIRFDYSRPFIACEVDVGTAGTLDDKWADYVSRAGQSGGRLKIHLMQVTDGGYTRDWLIPLRAATEEVVVGVELLAMDRTVVGREIAARVHTLMETKDIVEIHCHFSVSDFRAELVVTQASSASVAIEHKRLLSFFSPEVAIESW
ncbi:hypothetical protein B0H13DRAFT_1889775 [Mycena leptocephala]|nr:hypothetical protein B0H13DRAFT_1889775 [Mycena leptocephala]